MYGHRVCIPEKYQNQVLEELHVGHPGIVKMKAIARSYCYWQGIDASIANFVQNCSACIAARNEPARINRHPWEWPNGPWQRIHVDYAGPFMGKIFFVVSDAYSKWIEVIPMKNITASFTTHHLRILFAHYGIPLTLRCIRTRLDLFKPNLRDKVVKKQSSRLDTESILREFQEGEKVAVRNYSGPIYNKWKIGTIINRDGTLSYSIQVGNEIWKRHVDQIRKCGKSIELSQAATEIPIYDKELNFPDEPVSDDVAESEPPAPVPEVVPEPKDVPVPATPSDDIHLSLYQTLPESRKLMCHSDAQTESGDLQRDSTCDSIFCRGGTVMYLATARSENLPSCVTRACFVYLFVFRSFFVLYMFGVVVVLLVRACVS
ncbi:uncharacterized protein K02A2.6 [Trichonephila clavipes]|nr:uncharacterized protein K02A2.6 [Trichonephila clavipes]